MVVGDVNELLERRLFYVPSYKIYGGVAGLYDFGPPGCAVKQNLLREWRRHFIKREGMLEVECASITPAAVLHTSGHVEKFQDFMVRDSVTQEIHRADHVLEHALRRYSERQKRLGSDRPARPRERHERRRAARRFVSFRSGVSDDRKPY
jgi:glycyl-tRNA synthetase